MVSPLEPLLDALENVDAQTRDWLAMAGADIPALQQQIASVECAISIVESRLDLRESRGAERNDARRIVLGLVADAFQSNERGAADEYPERLKEFIQAACHVGKIPLPREDRILNILPASVKVPRTTP